MVLVLCTSSDSAFIFVPRLRDILNGTRVMQCYLLNFNL